MNSKLTLFALIGVLLVALVTVALKLITLNETVRNNSAALFEAQEQANISATNKLIEQFKKYDGLVPDQAAIMSHVGYHFTNLWFAADQENWPLADFYLGEARANVKWAVRSKPFRKGPNGENVDLGAIAQALDNTNFGGLKKAIDAKEKAQFVTLYTETLSACYACHKASGKPYLRPQIPTSPEVRIINMDPNAKTPQ